MYLPYLGAVHYYVLPPTSSSSLVLVPGLANVLPAAPWQTYSTRHLVSATTRLEYMTSGVRTTSICTNRAVRLSDPLVLYLIGVLQE